MTLLQMSTSSMAQYSDEGQDEWVLENSMQKDAKKAGTFLDIGARDGDFFSNTRRLEQHGWTGTCVEPFPTRFSDFKRTCTVVAKALVKEKNLERTYANCEDGSGITGHSGFRAENKNPGSHRCTQTPVPQVTYAELGLPPTLGYVSLDVEGLEMELLEAFPFGTVCAKLWTIEGAGLSYFHSVA